MKYSSTNKPLVCMQTQSKCYKGTTTMKPVGVLWHSTGCNNTTIKRYVQPSDTKPEADTYTKEDWLKVLGKNAYNNDWNHISVQAGLNCWIGKLADGTVTTVQTMPWDFSPWGCGVGSKGTCNNGWIQFEICEDNLTSKTYFEAAYKEACEITAYLCSMYGIDPNGTVSFNGVTVPTILCHADSYKLKLGSNHGDVLHWFKKYNKTMDDVRNDVAELLKTTGVVEKEDSVQRIYRIRKSWTNAASQKGAYKYLKSAKECCQKAGPGYKVFDCDGNEVYAYIAPEATEPPVTDKKEEPIVSTTKAVYNLEYPQKHLIINRENINSDTESCTKAILAIKQNNVDFNADIAKNFFELAPKYGIDPMRAIAQSVLETGWFKFEGSYVKPEQCNYCGLGATGDGAVGASFETIEDGITAQLQHLYAYGCKDELPEGEVLVDPRFTYVTRGIAPCWEQLAGRWAVPGYDGDNAEESMNAGTTYGQKIDKIYNTLISKAVTSDDIALYFPTPAEDDEIAVDTEETNKVNVKKVNSILALLEKVLSAILSWFTKKEQ